jgi:glycosyltransferase involved in cell wall biosynthesis
MLQEAGELIGSEEVKLIELANAIDTHAIRRDADAPVELPPIPYIVSVARLDEGQKDHTTQLRAFAQLPKWQRTPHMLVLVGDGRERSMLETEADALGIAAEVRFTGFCANPFPLIRHAQMLVLSSRYEGFGMGLAEAMTLGRQRQSSWPV